MYYFALSFLDPEPQFLLSALNQQMAPKYAKLNKALIDLVSNLDYFKNISHCH